MSPPNPNPIRISTAIWRLWTELDAYYAPGLLGGIYAAKKGYHNYRNALSASDYSVQLLADKRGSGTKASGLDWSLDTTAMKLHTSRLDKAARARDPRLYTPAGPVLREFIGTLNGSTVYCYVLTGGKALGVKDSSGNLVDVGPDPGRDSSHLWHIHLSIIRQFCEDWTALDGVLSVLRGESLAAWRERTTMSLTDPQENQLGFTDGRVEAMANMTDTVREDHQFGPGRPMKLVTAIKGIASGVEAIARAIPEVDNQVADQVNAALTQVKEAVEATPSQVIAQLTAIPRQEGATALITAIGEDEARRFAEEVLAQTNRVAG